MSAAVAAANVVLGFVFVQFGALTAWEMWGQRRSLGVSQFGLAWVGLAFTCGLHFILHGFQMGFEDRPGTALDGVTVLLGLPAAVVWFALRGETLRGRAGDRLVKGDPWWVVILPPVAGAYVASFVAVVARGTELAAGDAPAAAPSVVLAGVYLVIGWYLGRAQLANRRPLGGWSLSGLSLAILFPTCAAMQAVFAYERLSGSYGVDATGLLVDLMAVPAAAYFLWVIHSLYRGRHYDWNAGPMRARPEPSG